MFRVPYRWLPRTFFRNIYSCWLDIRIGVCNILRWIPVIWHDADFDWGFLNSILIYKLSRMAKVMENGHGMSSHRHAKQLRICAELCRRLDADNYSDIAEKRFPGWTKSWSDRWNELEKQDCVLLGKMISKYYTHWWD